MCKKMLFWLKDVSPDQTVRICRVLDTAKMQVKSVTNGTKPETERR